MQNRCGTTAEMLFHNQNKISCLQEKWAYQYNTPSIWRFFRNHKRRVGKCFYTSALLWLKFQKTKSKQCSERP